MSAFAQSRDSFRKSPVIEPAVTWKATRLVKLSIEGALIESARRIDESKRQRTVLADHHQLLGVRDLPDPDEALSEEERELFGLIDGHHTVAEVIEAAPLTEYETQEALHRMMEAKWVEFVGRREPGEPPPAPVRAAVPRARALVRETLAIAVGLIVMTGLVLGGRLMTRAGATPAAPADVFTTTQVRDLRKMLELYRRDHGAYPERLEQLVEDDWLTARELENPSHRIRYLRAPSGASYSVQLESRR